MYVIEPVIVVASGSFDPLHAGHVNYLIESKKLGTRLIVAIYSDQCLVRKKGLAFMTWEDRAAVVGALGCVDEVIKFDDSTNHIGNAIAIIQKCYPLSNIIYTNGKDRTAENLSKLEQYDIRFEFGVGGDYKANSSSAILRRYAAYVSSIAELEAGPNGRYT